MLNMPATETEPALSLREIQVLDLLRQEQGLSQRGLAKRMGVALGLANSLLKQLVQKSCVNVVRTDARHFAYLCTPRGLAVKASRALKHLENSFESYQQARHIVREAAAELERRGARRVGIYGKGDVGELVYVALKDLGLEVAALVDEGHTGDRWLGQEVLGLGQASSLGLDAVVLASAEPDPELVRDLEASLGCPLLTLVENGPVAYNDPGRLRLRKGDPA